MKTCFSSLQLVSSLMAPYRDTQSSSLLMIMLPPSLLSRVHAVGAPRHAPASPGFQVLGGGVEAWSGKGDGAAN